MVLRLVEAAQSQSVLGATSIREAFEDMLGMADAPRLLAPCIGELCGLQVLVAPDAEEPMEAPLSTWQLTAQGRDFWRRGLLPRRSNHETVVLGYDLVSGELSPWFEGQTGEQAPQACLDFSVPNLDFAPLVSAALHARRPPWFKSNTEIVSVQAGVVDTRWRIVALQLDLAADGALTLRAVNDDAFNAWLRSAQPEIVWERLVAPALGAARAQSVSGSPVLSLNDVAVASPIAPLSNAERKVSARNGWSLVVVSGEEPTEDLPAQAADIVHLRPASSRVSPSAHKLQVPKVAEDSIAVHLDTPGELPPGLRRIELRTPDGTPQAWSEGVAMMYWGGQGRPVQIRAQLTVERAQAAWDLVCAALREWLASQSQLTVVPLALWVASPEAAVAQWLRQAETLGSDAWLDELADFLTRLKHRLDISSEQLGRVPWATAVREGVLFFVGPTGVGKTELAKALAQFIFGDEEACLRFDMSEFNHEHADQRLVGAPPGYVGYESGGQLTNAVKQRPFSLLLFDEIEKAHPRILDKFLQILEDGRLTDGKGETMSFSETMIVFTSNIGASQVDPNAVDVRAAFVERVRDHFCHKLDRPELLGRIGESNIVPFNFIRSEDFLVDIARTKLTPLRQRLREKWGIEELRFQDEARALRAIVRQADPTAGGRGVPNAMMKHLFDPLSSFLFENLAHPDDARGKVLQVMQAGDQAAFIFDVA